MWWWKAAKELLLALSETFSILRHNYATRFGLCDRKHRARCCRKFTGPSYIYMYVCALYFSRWAHNFGLWNIVYMPTSYVPICCIMIDILHILERKIEVQPISTMCLHGKNTNIYKLCQIQISTYFLFDNQNLSIEHSIFLINGMRSCRSKKIECSIDKFISYLQRCLILVPKYANSKYVNKKSIKHMKKFEIKLYQINKL